MSPKTDSETNVLTRTAWSRDVRPNSGVTYSRRSYYYDREFSDSIVRPTDRFEDSLSGGINEEYDHTPFPSARELHYLSLRGISKRQNEDTITRPHESSEWRLEDPFQRGRVLQSASAGRISKQQHEDTFTRPPESVRRQLPFSRGRILESASVNDDNDDGVNALQDGSPPEPAQALYGVPSQVPTAAIPTESEPGLTVAGLDLQTIAQGMVVAADVLVRITEAYQRIRDSDGYDGANDDDATDDEFFGLNLDPYHLEAGPPRQLRSLSKVPPLRNLPVRKTVAPRAQMAPSSTTRTASPMNETQGNTSCQINNATTTRSILPPLPAGKRVCYYLIATVFFGVLASFGLALWWAQSQGDVSAGFTIGGYVIAVDALVVAVVGVVHRPGCRCWKA
ncbi:hypothetical protein F4680DRAFT_402522 [Xylaria scruposa]|nr:hypothetical protein F4680DRAFT_402522 [Xylaria scruposa]